MIKIRKHDYGAGELLVSGISEDELREKLGVLEKKMINNIVFTNVSKDNGFPHLKLVWKKDDSPDMHFSGCDLTQIHDLLHEWFPERCK